MRAWMWWSRWLRTRVRTWMRGAWLRARLWLPRLRSWRLRRLRRLRRLLHMDWTRPGLLDAEAARRRGRTHALDPLLVLGPELDLVETA